MRIEEKAKMLMETNGALRSGLAKFMKEWAKASACGEELLAKVYEDEEGAYYLCSGSNDLEYVDCLGVRPCSDKPYFYDTMKPDQLRRIAESLPEAIEQIESQMNTRIAFKWHV